MAQPGLSTGSFKIWRSVNHEQAHALARDGEDMHDSGREEAGLPRLHVEFLLADLDVRSAFEKVGDLLDAGVQVGMGALTTFDLSHDDFKIPRADGFGADEAEVLGAAVVGGGIRFHIRLTHEIGHGSIQLCSAMPPSTAIVAPVT